MVCLVMSGDSGTLTEGQAPPSPLFAWPPKPLAAFKYLFRFPGYLYPWQILYFGLATVTWLYFLPALSRCVTFQPSWILEMFVRNLVLLVLIFGAWHYWLWSRKSQGLQYKYNAEWLETGKRKFLWGDQLRDNIFWCCVSAVPIWTAYEVLMMWAYANEMLPYIDPREEPVYFIVLLVCIPIIRLFHFYWVHRLLHWPPPSSKGYTTSITKTSTPGPGPLLPRIRLSTLFSSAVC